MSTAILVLSSVVNLAYGLFCYWLGYRRAFRIMLEELKK